MLYIIKEYLTLDGKSSFSKWFEELNPTAAAKVRTTIARIELGNFSNAKSLGSGVWEIKIDFGPGYRVYYGKDGENIIILLAGGTKNRQQQDIEKAKKLWIEFKKRNGGH